MIFSFHFTGNIDVSKKPDTRLEIKFCLENKPRTYIRCWMVINGNNQFIALNEFSHKEVGKTNHEDTKWIPGNILEPSEEQNVYQVILANKAVQDIIKDKVWNINNAHATLSEIVDEEKIQLGPNTYRIYVYFGTNKSKYQFQMDTVLEGNDYYLEEIIIYPKDPNYQNDIKNLPKKTFLYEIYKTEILIKQLMLSIRHSSRLPFIFAKTIK